MICTQFHCVNIKLDFTLLCVSSPSQPSKGWPTTLPLHRQPQPQPVPGVHSAKLRPRGAAAAEYHRGAVWGAEGKRCRPGEEYEGCVVQSHGDHVCVSDHKLYKIAHPE